jgi:acetyltransferase-like isoleucine patch superfamily enzyme
MFAYLWWKLRQYHLRDLLYLELESYLGWICRSWPSWLGYIPRALLCKLFFRRLAGFCFIQPNVFITHSWNIVCGRGLVVNSNTYIHGLGGVVFGDDVLIGPNVVISSGEHQYRGGRMPIKLQPITPKQITIGDGVWIGANAVIMPGITLASGTIVGAGAVVTKSTQPFTIVAGVPAKQIGTR